MNWDILILCVNIVITAFSAFSAYKSLRYFNKSKIITTYTQTNQLLEEVGEMLKKLPEALEAAPKFKKVITLRLLFVVLVASFLIISIR